MQASNDGRLNHRPPAKPTHEAVTNALRGGTLRRQPWCICGSTHELHAYHDDYARPLDVRWYCRFHHIGHYRLERLHGKGQTLFGFTEDAA